MKQRLLNTIVKINSWHEQGLNQILTPLKLSPIWSVVCLWLCNGCEVWLHCAINYLQVAFLLTIKRRVQQSWELWRSKFVVIRTWILQNIPCCRSEEQDTPVITFRWKWKICFMDILKNVCRMSFINHTICYVRKKSLSREYKL